MFVMGKCGVRLAGLGQGDIIVLITRIDLI